MSLFQNFLNVFARKNLADKKTIDIGGKKTVVTTGPTSKRDNSVDALPFLQKSLRVIQPGYEFEVVPLIRKLEIVNPDMHQAFNDLIRLANTGHKIKFDPGVKADQVDKMRKFLKDSAKGWTTGVSSADGIAAKMFRQVMIGGAIATEWVPNMKLDDIEEIRWLYPERIRFVLEKNSRRYQPYQYIKHRPIMVMTDKQLKRLNTNQFKYIALNGDTEVPYGTPPYIASLQAIATQHKMLDNIDYIVESLGLLGHVSALMDKPDSEEGEDDDAYRTRMTTLLTEFKARAQEGFRDGMNVGFKDEHEFDFQQTVKTAAGASELFEQNEYQVASGLNYDKAFMGRSSTETMVTILFTKMLSQLSDIQAIVRDNLEYGYKMALQLGGFSFKELSVEFNKSTITDTLKWQQAREIMIRNLNQLFKDGIISQEQYADEMGYVAPDQKEPRVDPNAENIQEDARIKQDREAGKDKSDKKVRDKGKDQGTTRRQNKLKVV